MEGTPSLLCVITKCAPIAALGLFVLMHGISFQFEYCYSRRIFAGLLFSMIGDALLIFEDLFLLGLVSFAVAHIIYFTAFGIKPFNFRLGLTLFSMSVPYSAVYLPFISDYILKVCVPIYMLLILGMLWRAVSRLAIFNKNDEWTWPNLCCSLGALFFVISDSVLSFHLFIFKVPYSHPIIMLTYYAAQLGIALSVVDSYESQEINHLVIQRHHVVSGVKDVYTHLTQSKVKSSGKSTTQNSSTAHIKSQ